MARTPFSVRFPPELVDALDGLAVRFRTSRSDLVEGLIDDIQNDERLAILKTAVAGAPTEKRNLRLSPTALTRLKELAGDLEPSDFLRRTIAYAATLVSPQEIQGAPTARHTRKPTSSGARGQAYSRYRHDEGMDTSRAHANLVGLLFIAVLLVGALAFAVVWLISHRERPSPAPDTPPRGQLGTGSDHVAGA
jgi:hypothetical protein